MEIIADILVFPGQGSQKIGMGKELYKDFAVAKDVFDRVDNALDFNLSKLMFEGDQEELNKTSNAQPAIMATSIAYFEVLKNLGIIDIDKIRFMAGHSLGEYSALCAAKALSLEDTAKLLKARGHYMMDACLKTNGAMAALIGINFEKAKVIATECNCYVANSNSPLQIVLSGEKSDIERACESAKNNGAKRAVVLPVSGAFHSPLMASAQNEMEKVLKDIKFAEPTIKVVGNYKAKAYENAEEIRELLAKQITGTVKWQESLGYMLEYGNARFVECGFGNVLSGLIKKTVDNAEVIGADELLKNSL